MPDYLIKVTTDVTLDRQGLDGLEDVVYDYLVDSKGASTEVDAEGVGLTDVETVFN